MIAYINSNGAKTKPQQLTIADKQQTQDIKKPTNQQTSNKQTTDKKTGNNFEHISQFSLIKLC